MSAPALRVVAAIGVGVLLAAAGAGCDSSSSPRSTGKQATGSPRPTDVDSCGSIKSDVIAAVATLSGLGPHARPAKDSPRLIVAARDEVGVARYNSPTAQQPALQTLFESLSQLRSAASTADPGAVDAAIRTTARNLAAYGKTCAAAAATAKPTLPPGADKIQHVVFVMMSGRSFDHYFASFPGADGAVSGSTKVCVPNPALRACSRPWHDPTTDDRGGPHTLPAGIADIHGGKMDGFVSQRLASLAYCRKPSHAKGVICKKEYAHPAVLGYHDAREIPNYWTYAQQFVLQDHMFAPNLGSDEATHLAMVSGWSAVCASPSITNSCRPTLGRPPAGDTTAQATPYQWTDLTFLLHQQGVSWRYYVAPGSVNACVGTPAQQIHCNPAVPGARPVGTPITWNPLPGFATVHEEGQLGNVQFHPQFFDAASKGQLPAVSWIVPSWADGEQGPATASRGQAWVTKVVNAVMSGPDWAHSAIFVTWDGWGGFYDHVKPPVVDTQGYGIRVPGLMISPYAKRGVIDHQTLSSDAYLKLVEDLFLGGARLDPYTDGRWDPRRGVREEASGLGDLLTEFDFSQPPRRPVLLAASPR